MRALPLLSEGSSGVVVQTTGDAATVSIDQLSICAPSEADEKTVLIKDLTLTVAAGQPTVIRGPNGAGKSSLFRVLSGLWRSESGSGRLEVPAGSFFMPQDCYFSVGTLLDQVSFSSAVVGTAIRVGQAHQCLCPSCCSGDVPTPINTG
jgi:putative ATP-binding cassette transporter